MIQQTNWVNGAGESIYLREDGSTTRRMRYVNGIAEGESINYDEMGNVTARKTFHAGHPIEDGGKHEIAK